MDRRLLSWAPAFPLAATVQYTMSVYADLPARMPTHWGINGQPNGWSPREFGAWVLPAVMAFVWALSIVLPRFDPRKANYEKFGAAYHLVITAILAFEGIIQWAMLNVARGQPVDINSVTYIGLGALFLILGLAMPFTKPTGSFGQAAGTLIAACGVFTIFVALIPGQPVVKFVAVVTAALASTAGSVLLSYIYRRRG